MDLITHEIFVLQPDILNISESWLHSNVDNDELTIDGYNLVRQDRGNHNYGTIKRGGGLCIYIKQDIEMIGIKVMSPFTRDIYVFNTYRPPAGNVDTFIKNVQDVFVFFKESW